jgi:hypothetical protein
MVAEPVGECLQVLIVEKDTFHDGSVGFEHFDVFPCRGHDSILSFSVV